ncbi:hypothetical protein C3495_02135 [Clostridiaceae bacterium 14S0207]|nr:hypothetical protein C3495_02135 [Clostridiaceae bacterium 14S0207]
MHKDQLINLEPSVREQVMREELGEEKCKILDKYGLQPNERIYWEKVQEKYPTQEYFSHKFAVKSSVLGMIFQIYRLCFAKTKYFENNWDKFIPCVYTLREGFIETELYNMEFIKHKKTGLIIDLRELSKIHRIQDFKDLCLYIENKEKELERKIG